MPAHLSSQALLWLAFVCAPRVKVFHGSAAQFPSMRCAHSCARKVHRCVSSAIKSAPDIRPALPSTVHFIVGIDPQSEAGEAGKILADTRDEEYGPFNLILGKNFVHKYVLCMCLAFSVSVASTGAAPPCATFLISLRV